MRFVLDTDTCIDVLRQKRETWERLQSQSPDDVSVSAMTLAELRYGAFLSQSPAVNLARIDAFLGDVIQVLPFDTAAAGHHAEIRRSLRRQPISERDLVIASTARALGLTLITRNLREFARVPDLSVDTWG